MSGKRNSRKLNPPNVLNTSTNLSENVEDESTESYVPKYQEDSDYDEAFKNLLRPIESITKKNNCEPLQYDLLKELDSYLDHLKESSEGGSSVFVEAALMFQNVILLYQKRVDHLIDVMTKLIGKFRAYRINQDENTGDDLENAEGNKKKKKEKKVKYYPSFDPIKGQIIGTLKIFDCKVINLSKRPAVPKIVLNSNIKVENKYNKILPYIFIGNGENIGKKYEFMINYPLNRDLAVNEEFDCSTKEDKKLESSFKYLTNNDLFPMNLMDVDEIDSDDILPSTPDPVIYDQTVTDEVCVANAMETNPPNILNVSQIPPTKNVNDWDSILNDEGTNNYPEKPLTTKKNQKKENDGVWIPAFTFGELRGQIFRLKSGMSVDDTFRKLVRRAIDLQRSDTKKKKKCPADEKKPFGCVNEELEAKLKSGEEPGFRGFESPIYNGEFNDDIFENDNEQEQPADLPEENFELYTKEVEMHDQNQEKIMNEQLEMTKRVQAWHDNLRPILEEEEKRVAFDIHEYGTRILDCFESKGEQKSFEELAAGLEKEEVARYFLSTLMMTNTYNVKIIKPEESGGELKIELLKKERHHEELQINIGNQINQEPNE